jgi:hypothetical protein
MSQILRIATSEQALADKACAQLQMQVQHMLSAEAAPFALPGLCFVAATVMFL